MPWFKSPLLFCFPLCPLCILPTHSPLCRQYKDELKWAGSEVNRPCELTSFQSWITRRCCTHTYTNVFLIGQRKILNLILKQQWKKDSFGQVKNWNKNGNKCTKCIWKSSKGFFKNDSKIDVCYWHFCNHFSLLLVLILLKIKSVFFRLSRYYF